MNAMILEVVLTVCAAAAPSQCHDERFKMVEPDISLLQCQMGMVVLPDIVRWKLKHPEWRVAAWSCREYKPEKDV